MLDVCVCVHADRHNMLARDDKCSKHIQYKTYQCTRTHACTHTHTHTHLVKWEGVFCFSAGGPLLTITTSTVFASLGKPLYVARYNMVTVNMMPSLPMHFCTIKAINKACSALQETMCSCIFACHLFWINSCRTPANIVIDPNLIKQILMLDYVRMPEN